MRRFLILSLTLLLPVRADENLLSTLRKGHPRLMLTPDRIEEIRKTNASDPLAKHWQDLLIAEAKGMLASKPQTYSLDNKKLLNESRAVLKRVSTLAALHRFTDDASFATRAREELAAAATFPDWNPASFLSTAEMTLAFSLGYDWLQDVLPPAEKETIRKAIIEKGLKPGLAVYEKGKGWPGVTHNWNSVCNNGMIAGALAVAETDPEIAAAILKAAKASLPKGYRDYAPDGGWPEGPGYWQYGTSYAIYGLACLESALGTDWNLAASTGFSQTGDFRIDLIGPSGMNFNFADGGVVPGPASCMFWLAKHFNRPDFDAAERLVSAEKPSIFHLVFFNPSFGNSAATEALEKRPLSRKFSGTNVAVLRSSKEKSATWLAIKGGSNKVNHAHLDLGTFVLENRGQRFAEELGADLYTLPGYFGSQRWNYYRLRTEGQNTLVIGGENQSTKAAAEIIAFTDSSTTIDLTAAYPSAERIHRTASLTANAEAKLDDQIILKQAAPIIWSMHTKAKVSASGKTATLSRGKATFNAEILSPSDATFTVTPVNIPEPQRPDDNLRKLSVNIPATNKARITIRFTPQ